MANSDCVLSHSLASRYFSVGFCLILFFFLALAFCLTFGLFGLSAAHFQSGFAINFCYSKYAHRNGCTLIYIHIYLWVAVA